MFYTAGTLYHIEGLKCHPQTKFRSYKSTSCSKENLLSYLLFLLLNLDAQQKKEGVKRTAN